MLTLYPSENRDICHTVTLQICSLKIWQHYITWSAQNFDSFSYSVLQGVLLNSLSIKSLYIFWHLEKWLTWDLVLRKFRGAPVKMDTLYICPVYPNLERGSTVLLLLLLLLLLYMSRSGYPPCILKQVGLESSGQRINS